MVDNACYADGMSTPEDLATPVNHATDPQNVHERIGQQPVYRAINGKDVRRAERDETSGFRLLARIRLALPTAGVVGIGAILVLSLVPGDLRPHVVASSRLEHVMAYFCVMSAFGLSAWSVRQALGAALLLGCIASLTEIAQGHIPGHHADITDALFSCLGILVGLLLSGVAAGVLRR